MGTFAHDMQVMQMVLPANEPADKDILATRAVIRKSAATIGLCLPVQTFDHEALQLP
jgi:hypothetical protein